MPSPTPSSQPASLPVRRLALLALTLLAAVLAACGSDADPTPQSSPTTAGEASVFPVTVEGANGAVTLDAAPKRIVSISPTATEMLFAVGAGGQVVAVDDQSSFPANAPRTDLSGFEPNLEAIAGYQPDLVVASNDPKDLVAGLDKLKIPTLLLPAAETLDDSYEQLEVLGRATGHATTATGVVDDLKAEVEQLLAGLPKRTEKLTYYHELDETLFTATSKTFIGHIYGLAGLENIADAADADGSGYPQLSVEYLLKQDPDLIFLADTKCCGQTAEKVAARPGWGQLKAVKGGDVVGLDDDVASRWGPRVVEFLAAVTKAVAGVTP